VRARDWERLRPLNFGRIPCGNPLTAENLLAEIARYDPADAAAVCSSTRANAGIEHAADAFLSLYDEVIREHSAAPVAPEVEARASAEYLRTRLAYPIVTRAGAAETEQWKASAEAAHRGWAEFRKEYEAVRAACDAAHRGWAELQEEYERVLAECRRLQESVSRLHAA
jgi:hypothetical protein